MGTSLVFTWERSKQTGTAWVLVANIETEVYWNRPV